VQLECTMEICKDTTYWACSKDGGATECMQNFGGENFWKAAT